MKTSIFLVYILCILGSLISVLWLTDIFEFMRPAPPGIFGLYSKIDSNQVYKVKYRKDSLLTHFKNSGLSVKEKMPNENEAPWDSLSYALQNIRCNSEIVIAHIEFQKEQTAGFTTFQISSIEARPTASYDTMKYRNLTREYYNCVEHVLRKYEVLFKLYHNN